MSTYVLNWVTFPLVNLSHVCLIIRPARKTLRIEESLFFPHSWRDKQDKLTGWNPVIPHETAADEITEHLTQPAGGKGSYHVSTPPSSVGSGESESGENLSFKFTLARENICETHFLD